MKKTLIAGGIVIVIAVFAFVFLNQSSPRLSSLNLNNPTQITSSSVNAALPSPLSLAGGLSVNGNVTGTTGGFTNGFTAYGLSFVGNLATYYYFPSPTQLAAGFTCGTTAGDTEVGKCLTDMYTAGSVVASTTDITFGAYTYSSSRACSH